MKRPRIIFCDFDGTITRLDVGNIILNHFTNSSWDSIDNDFIGGRIGSREAYQRIAPLIQGTKEEIGNYIGENFDMDEEFDLFVQNCALYGDKPVILSDGFDIYIEILLKKRGLYKKVPFRANCWRFTDEGGVCFSFPFYNPFCDIDGGKCGNCKLNHLLDIKGSKKEIYGQIIYIGNGYSDRCPVAEADLVLAKDSLEQFCIQNGIEFMTFKDFHEVNLMLF